MSFLFVTEKERKDDERNTLFVEAEHGYPQDDTFEIVRQLLRDLKQACAREYRLLVRKSTRSSSAFYLRKRSVDHHLSYSTVQLGY